VMLNVGFHNEHHDLMMIPWNRLPALKKMAPEFYDTLVFHTSYWKLLGRFIFDSNISLYSRVTRDYQSMQSNAYQNEHQNKAHQIEPEYGVVLQ